MSIVIQGMKMPESCRDCPCFNDEYWRCQVGNLWDKGSCPDRTKPEWCPLLPLPEKHGKLIDADDFVNHYRKSYCANCGRRKGMKNGKEKYVYDIGDAPCRACDIDDMIDCVENHTTVIPAEGEEET